MKIFTWMHRKLHTNVDYCMISREKDSLSNGVKKSSALVTCDKDTKALLHDRDHVTLVDVLGGWEDGILAIGTFGLDQLKPFEYSVQEEEYSVEDEDDEEEEDEEELSPFAVRAFKHEFERAFHVSCDAERERQMLKSQPLMSVETETDNPARPFLEVTEMENEDSGKEEKKKGERTTLADLFYADAALFAAEKCIAPELSSDTGKKTVYPTKHVRSFAKKLLPWKGEDSRPTTKLHGLIRRMLKRKIHPELERKIHGAIGDNDASKLEETALGDPSLEYNSSAETGGIESVSFL